jgi:competence protein ComGC
MEPALPTTPSSRTSPLAIWSLVLGILGVVLLIICIGPLFAIPAIICGHLAYSRIKRSGGALQGGGMALAGLITGYVGIVLALVWIPLMAAIAIPNFVKARETAQKNLCLNNLRRIEGAKEVWALQNNKDTNSTPTMQELTPFLKGNVTRLHCPAGGAYSINKVGVPPTCSISSHDLFNPGASIQEILNDKTNSAR